MFQTPFIPGSRYHPCKISSTTSGTKSVQVHSLAAKVYSSLEKFFTKNDWLAGLKKSLETFEINSTIDKIQSMKAMKFKNIVKMKAQKAAYKYMVDKLNNVKKGKLVSYKQMEMVDYLTLECSLSEQDKTGMFSF